jgi:hypothetical protein
MQLIAVTFVTVFDGSIRREMATQKQRPSPFAISAADFAR